MSQIKGSNTKPEIAVRSYLHRNGLRFRIHDKKLPGKPDIALKKYNTAIFIDGCFWHRHVNCKYAYNPKTRKNFWNKKFTDTIKRDIKNNIELEKLGWKSVVIWECETQDQDLLRDQILKIIKLYKKNSHTFDFNFRWITRSKKCWCLFENGQCIRC